MSIQAEEEVALSAEAFVEGLPRNVDSLSNRDDKHFCKEAMDDEMKTLK